MCDPLCNTPDPSVQQKQMENEKWKIAFCFLLGMAFNRHALCFDLCYRRKSAA